MPSIRFTARTADSLKPVPGKRMEYFDLAQPGLALRVTETGSKAWTLLYRHRGKLRRLTLGTPKELGLADARDRARDALRQVRDGVDPAFEKKRGRTAETIGDLADLYIARWAKPRKRSWKADRNLLDNKVLPKWRKRAIADITRSDVRDLVNGVAEAGAPIVANRVAALLSKVFAFALDRELIDVSPAVRIPRPGTERQRDRVLTEDEIRTLWASFVALPTEMAAFYKLRLLTAQRGGEVASMRWADVDLQGSWWTIPATTAKNKLAHRVPLSDGACRILGDLLTGARKEAVYVLEGARGKRQQAEAAATFTVEDFRGHDLRRTAASLMTSGGIPRLTVSKILNHAERGITAVYDRHGYDAEKQAALAWWDQKLASIVGGKPAGAVLPFRKEA